MIGSIGQIVSIASVQASSVDPKGQDRKEAYRRLKEAGINTYDPRFRKVFDQLDQHFDPAYVDALIYLHKNGVKVNDNTVNMVRLEDVKTPGFLDMVIQYYKVGGFVDRFTAYRLLTLKNAGIEVNDELARCFGNNFIGDFHGNALKGLLLLHASGAKVDCQLIKSLPFSEKYDPSYYEAEAAKYEIERLRQAGIKIGDDEMIALTATKKASSPAYVDGLILLHKAGVKIDREIIDAIPLERGRDERVMASIAELSQAGAKVTRFFLDHFLFKKCDDPQYTSVLLELCKAGISIDSVFVYKFGIEKSHSRGFVDALILLHRSGVKVDAALVSSLTVAQAADRKFLDAAIELNKPFKQVNWGPVEEYARSAGLDPRYVETLKKLGANGVVIDLPVLAELTEEKAISKTYIDNLIRLQRSGADVTGKVLAGLTLEKGRSKAYVDAVILFKKELFLDADRTIEAVPLSLGEDPAWVSGLMRLHNAGIDVDDVTMIYGSKKILNKGYIDALIRLNDAGMHIDFFVVNFLSIEKANDPVYINALIELRKNGIIDNMRTNGWIVETLTIDDAHDPVYIQALITIQAAGVQVDGNTIKNLCIKDAHDPVYVQDLINSAKKK